MSQGGDVSSKPEYHMIDTADFAEFAGMTYSSPSRRPQFGSSPDRGLRVGFLFNPRNTESSHVDALSAALAEHDRVREAAIRAFELNELKEEHQRILDQERREEERLKTEAKIAAEEKKLQELRATTILKPTLPTPSLIPKPQEQFATKTTPVQSSPDVKKPDQAQNEFNARPPPASSLNSPASSLNPLVLSRQNDRVTTSNSKPAEPPLNQTQPAAQTAVLKPPVDRLVQIHKELKALRADLVKLSRTPESPLKGKIGAYRREIRVAIGQLTGGKGANSQPTIKIISILKDSLAGQIPSPPVHVSRFVASSRPPAEGGSNNNSKLPALFIYLINICAKSIISQFINECGANPKAADPIGVFTAQLFSQKEFYWRGESLIDILLAKYRIVCPVLFGYRGSDKTEKGRLAIGWLREGSKWITEQSHNDRMAGLGAGFAAVSLRDFSKSSRVNPLPPRHYWVALAGIVNTPANETSNTQCVVLRAMIDGHEKRFIEVYGNAAIAALRAALIDFPNKAPQNASAAGSLCAVAEVLQTEAGLNFV